MGDPYLIDNPCTKRVRAFKEALRQRGFEVVIIFDMFPPLRTGSHHRHIPSDDIENLRQFINPESPDDAAHFRNPRVMVCTGDDGSLFYTEDF